MLHLVYSPKKTADDILKKLSKPEKKEKEEALEKLSHLSNDITFAAEFINKQVSQISSSKGELPLSKQCQQHTPPTEQRCQKKRSVLVQEVTSHFPPDSNSLNYGKGGNTI